MAQSSGLLLGVGYSEMLVGYTTKIATDSSGAVYIMSFLPGSCCGLVSKLSADGTTILWQNQLGFSVNAMAVDPNGGVYVTPVSQPGDTSIYVAKLGATGLAWKMPVGFVASVGYGSFLAADSQGRVYVAAATDATNNKAELVRLNAAGSAVDYTAQVAGIPAAIAADSSGAAFVAGYTFVQNTFTGFLARVALDGSSGFYATLLQAPAAVAVNASGDALVLEDYGALQRVDSTGAVTPVTTVPGFAYAGGFALDAAGNAYIAETSNQEFQVKNSLTTCGNAPWGFDFLTVVAPDGAILQTTYIPGTAGAANPQGPVLATGPNSTVYLLATAGPSYAATQAGPFVLAPEAVPTFLLSLSPNANAPISPLACLANGASFQAVPIAPGEIVTLLGTGLGPQQGVQPQATLQSPFPTQAAGVEVTFDGKPVPLLWVQDAQINAMAPWSLTPGENTQVCVSYNNVKTNCLTWAVAETAPAVFTVDGTYATASNQDGSMNTASNPAPVGSIVTVWATGLGSITPAQADGTLVGLPLPTNVLTIGVYASDTVGTNCLLFCVWQPFAVEYAGPAPYLVAGASQINFQAADYPGEIYLTVQSSGNVDVYWNSSQGFQIYVAGQ